MLTFHDAATRRASGHTPGHAPGSHVGRPDSEDKTGRPVIERNLGEAGIGRGKTTSYLKLRLFAQMRMLATSSRGGGGHVTPGRARSRDLWATAPHPASPSAGAPGRPWEGEEALSRGHQAQSWVHPGRSHPPHTAPSSCTRDGTVPASGALEGGGGSDSTWQR